MERMSIFKLQRKTVGLLLCHASYVNFGEVS